MDIESSPKSGASAMFPLFCGLGGIAVGAIALIISLNAAGKKDVADLSAKVSDMSAKLDPIVATVQDLDPKVKSANDGVNNLRTEVQTALNGIGDEINKDRVVIQTQGATLEKLTKGSSGTAKAASGKAGAEATSNVVAGQGGVHVIATGDTFGKLATKYGVTVAAIEAANPSVNANKLQVGDKINIPAGKGSSGPKPSSASSTPASAATATTSP